MYKIALIDLGSSTIKLNIYDKNSWALLEKQSQTINLAENFYPNLLITQASLERCKKALIDIKSLLNSKNIHDIRVFTTGIARRAKNVEKVKKLVNNILNTKLKIISGEEEADLFFMGINCDFDEKAKIVAINIGGGSTEITFGTKENVHKKYSFPIGVTSLNEKFLTGNPPKQEDLQKMHEYLNKVIHIEIDVLEEFKPRFLVHTGGELEYMKITNHDLESSAVSPSHPKQITLKKFKDKYTEIAGKTREELYKLMPNNPKWMDGAVSCTAIAITVAEKTGVDIIIPSNKNLNDGILKAMLKEE